MRNAFEFRLERELNLMMKNHLFYKTNIFSIITFHITLLNSGIDKLNIITENLGQNFS